MTLPVDPITNQSLPYSNEYMAVATHLKNTGSTVPYSNEYVISVGIDPTK